MKKELFKLANKELRYLVDAFNKNLIVVRRNNTYESCMVIERGMFIRDREFTYADTMARSYYADLEQHHFMSTKMVKAWVADLTQLDLEILSLQTTIKNLSEDSADPAFRELLIKDYKTKRQLMMKKIGNFFDNDVYDRHDMDEEKAMKIASAWNLEQEIRDEHEMLIAIGAVARADDAQAWIMALDNWDI